MKKSQITRRTFMQGAAVASLAGLSACSSLKYAPWSDMAKVPECTKISLKNPRKPRKLRKGEKMNIAIIGCGGKGAVDSQGVSTENIVALCDVDLDRAKKTIDKYPNVPVYRDFRKMLVEMDDQIDAVTVSIPDHMHFAPAMMAIQMGKHVYCQKPLTHTVWEARQLTLAARRHGVTTQMGNQGHAGDGTRRMREWIQGGLVGDVREVHIWTNRPIWPQGIKEPLPAQPIPDTMDWNLWLGTAPERPYNENYAPFKWRGWWDFGCGALGDMGCHIMDAAFWSLDLKYPISVEAKSEPVNPETAPNWSTITYKFPARGKMPPLTLKWWDGKLPSGKQNFPPRPKDLEESRKFAKGGQIILGDKGTIMDTSDYCQSPRVIPEAKMKSLMKKLPPETIPRIEKGDPYQEWIRACKGGPKAGSNFDYSGPLTEMVSLGNLAIRSGKKLDWDGPNMRVTNCPEANKYVRYGYRKY